MTVAEPFRNASPESRRSAGLLRSLAAAAAAAVLAAAPGAHAKNLTVAISSTLTTLDPWNAPDIMSRNVASSIYEGLMRFDDAMKPVPALAESYSISKDGLVYDFKLRAGVKFHDGTDFDAAAVKANFDRALNPERPASRASYYKMIDRIEVVDPLTVRFVLKAPTGGFLARLAMSAAAMVCPSYLAQYAENKGLTARACGTGPYTLESADLTERVVVTKNPNYRVAGLPKLDRITWMPVADANARGAMLRTGEADVISSVPIEQIETLRASPGIVVEEVPALMQKHLDLNNYHKPFNDVRVRQAVNYAINKEALIKVVFHGHAAAARGLYTKDYPGAIDFGVWPYDPKKARELLAEAGYPNGFETTLWSEYNDATAGKTVQFIAQQLRQVGIRVKTQLLEPGIRSQLIYDVDGPAASKTRMVLSGWSGGTVDPDLVLRSLLDSREMPPKFFNTTYYNNPAFDKLIDQALVEPDAQKRSDLYREAQQMAWKDAHWAYLYFEMATAASKTSVKNFRIRPDNTFDFYGAEWSAPSED